LDVLENRKIIVNELRRRQGKFSDEELSSPKGEDDLASRVQSRYGLNNEKALPDSDAPLQGLAFYCGMHISNTRPLRQQSSTYCRRCID
jgi:hypothetical protein